MPCFILHPPKNFDIETKIYHIAMKKKSKKRKKHTHIHIQTVAFCSTQVQLWKVFPRDTTATTRCKWKKCWVEMQKKCWNLMGLRCKLFGICHLFHVLFLRPIFRHDLVNGAYMLHCTVYTIFSATMVLLYSINADRSDD